MEDAEGETDMIPFEFEYYRPETIQEAVETYQNIQTGGKTVIFYGGGTEFITFARLNTVTADAVIDIKGIQECNVLTFQDDQLVIGAALSLNKINEANVFPLLGQTIKKIADHTSRNKISIGGNLTSRLIYREGVLPLLLAEANVKIASSEGELTIPFEDIFYQELKLSPGQFLVQIIIDKACTRLPFVSLKKTKMSKVGYPVVTVAAVMKNKQIQAAISGVCTYPFRSKKLEAALNDSSLTKEERVEKAVSLLPDTIISDLLGSAEYREFVLKNALLEAIDVLEVEQA